MALQLLKRNYTMQGYEVPKILKLPQGETRWAPRRLPVDVGDIMMNIRMNDDKSKFVGEHISKYAQGINPYGEYGYPYKVNKNNIRAPIVDPKFYEPLSRMPVKFDSVTVGPIVKDLYGKQVEIDKLAPKAVIDTIAETSAATNPSDRRQNCTDDYREGNIELHLKQPRTSIPYHPSMPVHINTGVPEIELSGKIIARPNMGIHFPYHISDQSRDVGNMRTPMHVAVTPGYKDPYTSVTMAPDEMELESKIQTAAQPNVVAPTPTISNLTRDGYNLTPKLQTSAWYNPSYSIMPGAGDYHIIDQTQSCIGDKLQTSANTNMSTHVQKNIETGDIKLREGLHLGGFDSRASIPVIAERPEFTRTAENAKIEGYTPTKEPYLSG